MTRKGYHDRDTIPPKNKLMPECNLLKNECGQLQEVAKEVIVRARGIMDA